MHEKECIVVAVVFNCNLFSNFMPSTSQTTMFYFSLKTIFGFSRDTNRICQVIVFNNVKTVMKIESDFKLNGKY